MIKGLDEEQPIQQGFVNIYVTGNDEIKSKEKLIRKQFKLDKNDDVNINDDENINNDENINDDGDDDKEYEDGNDEDSLEAKILGNYLEMFYYILEQRIDKARNRKPGIFEDPTNKLNKLDEEALGEEEMGEDVVDEDVNEVEEKKKLLDEEYGIYYYLKYPWFDGD
ncbi:hypothetical protein O3M35_010010 [Rhynocoris fuscipes]|uniref:Uncharacterized protein n=1 Tax=Rhynocoris fuscipes TaxID=488301 RepID=A0AAW1D542_9HEMI